MNLSRSGKCIPGIRERVSKGGAKRALSVWMRRDTKKYAASGRVMVCDQCTHTHAAAGIIVSDFFGRKTSSPKWTLRGTRINGGGWMKTDGWHSVLWALYWGKMRLRNKSTVLLSPCYYVFLTAAPRCINYVM